MNWDRLKNLQCPQCARVLTRNIRNDGYKCTCGFFITNGKFTAIVDKIYKKEHRNYQDEIELNLGQLNNL